MALYAAAEHIDDCLVRAEEQERNQTNGARDEAITGLSPPYVPNPLAKKVESNPSQGCDNKRDAFKLLLESSAKSRDTERNDLGVRSSSQHYPQQFDVQLPNDLRVSPHEHLRGQFTVQNFISEKEERELLQWLDTDAANPWRIVCVGSTDAASTLGTGTESFCIAF